MPEPTAPLNHEVSRTTRRCLNNNHIEKQVASFSDARYRVMWCANCGHLRISEYNNLHWSGPHTPALMIDLGEVYSEKDAAPTFDDLEGTIPQQ